MVGDDEFFAVVILGGGPAGCAAALSLVAEGLAPEEILVVEASHYERERIGESIPPDSRALLAELGVIEAFLREGHEPCLGSASSWGADELGHNDFLFNPFGSGWHLDRRRFDAWLAAEVEGRGVELRRDLGYLDVLTDGPEGARPEGARLSLGDADREQCRVRARFVVDATGQRARYATRVGARRRELDRLVCVAAYFELPEESSFAKLTYLEAVEYGWWYTARLPGRRIATALATSHALYKQRRFNHPRAWLEALARTRHVAGVLEQCRPLTDSFSMCTAPSFLLDPVHGEHWLALGDAASAYDPISSQGIYKALGDGLRGGRAVAAHLAGDGDALTRHRDEVEAAFEIYVQQRAYFYGQEQRWAEAPFWRERRAAGWMTDSSAEPIGEGASA